MSATLKRYLAVKEKAENLQRQVDKASGALEQIIARAHKEFDCDDLASLKRLLAKEEEALEAKEAEFVSECRKLDEALNLHESLNKH